MLFLRTGDDNSIERGIITIEKLKNTWELYASFILDDQSMSTPGSIDNDIEYYGPYPELYEPLFNKYLNFSE